MKPILAACSALALLTACATAPDPQETTIAPAFLRAELVEDTSAPVIEVVETVTPLPLPGQMKPLTETRPGASMPPGQAIQEGTSAARIEPSVDGFVNAIQVYPYTEGALYRLYTSPGQVTDIALQPGETLVSVSAGDTARWVVGDTQSGSGPAARSHVLVKPVQHGIKTNLMIATDRRTYYLELDSVYDGYMAALSWRYPQDELAQARSRAALQRTEGAASISRSLSLTDLNFDYRITGDRPRWTPVRAFDDGRQVFIQMPEAMNSSDAPPLFILGEAGDAELVNYRVRGGYYIVDRLFETAELRLGEKDQTVVRIHRSQKRAGLAALFGGRN
ncbi:MAG: P-type conjugative transfer protein TrbG [Henriciella sp.]|uniref:P-type conjugative transfer protein TrbG n=1 Tax=Henriciella sp. TaxID=1968823 RepID=UPI003C712EE4